MLLLLELVLLLMKRLGSVSSRAQSRIGNEALYCEDWQVAFWVS